MGRLIGIDLGTTNSVAAIVDGPQPRVLENREARTQTRSAVGMRKKKTAGGGAEQQVLVGDAAIDNWPLAPNDTIVSIKRLMGRSVDDPQVKRLAREVQYSIVEPREGTRESVRVLLAGKEYSPIEISAMILKKVKEDAEFRLGESVTHAVITVPAYFTQIQRDATRKAGLLAGLKVIKILDEPTAAAVAFGVQASDDTPRTVLVYDLGGGTLDISVLMCAGTVFAPLNLEGDMWLGGDNFDEAIVHHTLRHIKAEYGIDPVKNHRFMVELKRAAQTVKERLSAADGADLLVTGLLQDGAGNLIDIDLHVTRSELERLLLPLLDEYVECPNGHSNFITDSLCAFCRSSLDGVTPKDGRALALTKRALEHPSVNLRPDQVDYVVMAGNSTNMPLVQRTMERLFGADRIVRKTHPKHAVALGAAIVANWMGQRVVCQAVDRADPQRECGHVNDDDAVQCAKCGTPLGVQPGDAKGAGPTPLMGRVGGIAPVSYGTGAHQDVYKIFIRKNDPYPTEDPQAQTFFTTLPRQRMISIPIYGGENATRASANEKQGEAFAILPAGLPAPTPVRIKLWLNADGVLQIGAQLADGTNLRPWLVKGEKDARAIAAIEGVNAALDGGVLTDPEAIQQVEDARNRAFDRLRAEQFDEALQEAERANALVADRQAPAISSTPEALARDLLQWAVFVIDRYAFAFDRTMQLRLEGLIAELSSALESRDGARIGRAYNELDLATRSVPAIVDKLLQLRVALARRVTPGAPGVATTLFARIEQVEDLFRRENPDAPQALASLSSDIVAAIEQVARTVGIECSKKHSVPKGQRYCPECREDTWTLAAGV